MCSIICRYAIRLGYERKVNGWNSNDNGGESKYDNTFGINIELRGLSLTTALAPSRCCARTFCIVPELL
ncbi:hypothetical protein MJ561_04970 [Klebsiella pneumoniae]|nr:hypothetical protein MJ561_04970 [Klebsiella pneumoniae]